GRLGRNLFAQFMGTFTRAANLAGKCGCRPARGQGDPGRGLLLLRRGAGRTAPGRGISGAGSAGRSPVPPRPGVDYGTTILTRPRTARSSKRPAAHARTPEVPRRAVIVPRESNAGF